MDLKEHLGELRSRVIRIIVAVIFGMSVTFYISGSLLDKFWHSIFGDIPPYVLSPLEWIITRLSFSLILTLVILYPYIIYELYSFAKPGLYEHERKFIKSLIIPSYIIFVCGFFIAYKFIIPVLYNIALVSTAEPYLSAGKTVENAIKLLLAFGFFLQIPLVALLADRFGIVDYNTLKNMRLLVYIAVFLFLTNVTADFTGLTQIASLVLFVIMYELSLLLLRVAKNI